NANTSSPPPLWNPAEVFTHEPSQRDPISSALEVDVRDGLASCFDVGDCDGDAGIIGAEDLVGNHVGFILKREIDPVLRMSHSKVSEYAAKKCVLARCHLIVLSHGQQGLQSIGPPGADQTRMGRCHESGTLCPASTQMYSHAKLPASAIEPANAYAIGVAAARPAMIDRPLAAMAPPQKARANGPLRMAATASSWCRVGLGIRRFSKTMNTRWISIAQTRMIPSGGTSARP